MEKVFEFITQYWSYLSFAVVIVFEIVLLIVKKNKNTVIDNSVFSELCKLIAYAECHFKDGTEKLSYVLTTYISCHPDMIQYQGQIKEIIEYILSLPTKKGGYGRE